MRGSVAASAVLLLAPQAVLAQVDVSELVQRVGPSVLLIKAFDANGRPLAEGSGFLLSDRRVVTNTHVVRGASNVEILDASGRLVGITQYADALSNSMDLVILPPVQIDNPGLVLTAADPLVGSPVYVIGAPRGLQNTVSNGIVSAVRTLDGQSLIQISAALSEGSSGGPVVNPQGEVVGVAVSSVEQGQNLNFAIPAHGVAVLAASPAGQFAFGTVTSIADAPPTGTPIAYDEEFDSDLHTGLPQLSDGSYYEVWNFEGSQGQRIRIRMRSEAFDTFLILGRVVDGRFVRLAVNDDGGLFKRDSRLDFTLPADGQYLLYTTSYYGGAVGAYTLSLQRR